MEGLEQVKSSLQLYVYTATGWGREPGYETSQFVEWNGNQELGMGI